MVVCASGDFFGRRVSPHFCTDISFTLNNIVIKHIIPMAEYRPFNPSIAASDAPVATPFPPPPALPIEFTTATPPSSTKPKQKRRAITDLERKLIREHFHEKGGQIKHKELIQWYSQTHCRTFNQSTISESLSPKFAYLDHWSKTGHPERKRRREAWFPDLEHALFEWQQTLRKRGVSVTGEILLEEAKRLWTLLPQYRAEQEPKWSIGWVQNFNQRHSTRKHPPYGEGSSVDYEAVETELQGIRGNYAVTAQERDHGSDKGQAIGLHVRDQEALQFIQRLRLYEQQQEMGDTDLLLRLARYETTVRGRLIASHNKQQTDMSSFFGGTQDR